MLSAGHSFVYKKRKQPPALSVGKDILSPTGICRSLCSAVSIIFDGLDPLVWESDGSVMGMDTSRVNVPP